MLRAPLGPVDGAGPPDRLLQPGPNGGIQGLKGAGERFGGHPYPVQRHAVELVGVLDQRRRAAMAYVLADGPHLRQGGFHVELGTGQQAAQRAALGEGVAAQIDS